MKPTPRDVQWLVAQLDDQKRRLKNLENRKPGLAYSSIEDGAIREYDKDGILGSQTGKQSDGTHGNVVLNGPRPPKPTDPAVTAVPGMLEGRWNGKFDGGVASPLDLKHVAMYAVLAGDVLDLSKQAGVMTGELGDNVQVQVEAGVYNVYLVAWSKAGRFSDAAGPVPVLVPVAADMDAIQEALDDLDERYDGVITEAGQLGARLDLAETDIVAAESRLDTAGTRLDDAFGQISTVDGKATAAAGAASTAQSKADSALTMAGSATKAYYSTSTPSGVARTDRDVWRQINAVKDVIGEWFWDGTLSTPGWVKTLISSQSISNLDVGKLTVGTGIISDLVAEHIAGRSARFLQLDVSQLVAVTGTMSEAVITKLFTDVVMSRKITTQMLAIGSFDNLIPGGNFLDRAAWDGNSRLQLVAGQSELGGPVGRFDGRASTSSCYEALDNNSLPVVPLSSYRIRGRVRSNVDAPAASVRVMMRFEVGPGAYTYPTASAPALVAGQWAQVDAVVTAPANALGRRFALNVQATFPAGAYVDFSDVSATRMSDGELIVDGSLKARHADLESFAANTGFIADLTARIVRSDMFVGKEFYGGVFTGAVFQSPGGGAGFQLTENGYTSRDEAGNVTVRLPADGSPAQFKGDIEAQSLTVSGRASLHSANNEIASGAALVLEAGVTPPLTPPTVGTAFTTAPLAPLAAGESAVGLAYAQGLWWRGVRKTANALGRIEGLNSSGTVTVSQEIVEDPVNGLTAIGNTLYLLGTRNARPSGERWVVAYSVTTNAVTWSHFWQYTDYGTGTYQPGIGVNGSNILIGQVRINGPLTWRTYNNTTGALVSQIDSAFVRRDDVVGIVQTVGDFGATRIVVAFRNAVTEAFTTAGVNTGPSESWYSAGRAPNLGIAWQGGAFWQYAEQQGIVKYSPIKDPTGTGGRDTDDWWIATTWRGAGGVETTMGPPQRFTFMRRSELQLAAGTLPAGVTGVRFYLARNVTAPTRTDMHLLATVTGATARVATLPTNWATLASPPATNTFSAASPGQIRSRANSFQVAGDGSGKWGPLTFHPDGTMTSSAVPAWIPITSFQSGCTVGDFGFVPAYRSWPDGKVEMRGVIKGTLDTVKPIFSLPSAVRSAHPVNFVAATNAAGNVPAVMRIEIGSVENPDVMTIQPQGTTRSWISIDGLYYYQV